MNRYTITFYKEHGGKYYQTFVDANSEQEAFIIARDECENKGIILPDEVWTRTKKHKQSPKHE